MPKRKYMKKIEIQSTIVLIASDKYAKYLTEDVSHEELGDHILKSCFRNNRRTIKKYSVKERGQECLR